MRYNLEKAFEEPDLLNMRARFIQRKTMTNKHLVTQKAGVDIVHDLGTCAICGARPHPNPPECLSQTIPPYTFIFISPLIQLTLREDVTYTS